MKGIVRKEETQYSINKSIIQYQRNIQEHEPSTVPDAQEHSRTTVQGNQGQKEVNTLQEKLSSAKEWL